MRLQQEVVHLRRRVDCLVALLRLMALLLKLTGSSLESVRLPEGRSKARLLQTIDRARAHFSLRAVLRMIGLSNTRYHAWKRESDCALADRPCCPRRSPQQLTFDEVNAIRDMVTSDDYRHVRAVIDNFSRRILAWNVSGSFDLESTAKMLVDAAGRMHSPGVPTVMTDGGGENFNPAVDQLVQAGTLKRVLAQTDVPFSNSMIEAWVARIRAKSPKCCDA